MMMLGAGALLARFILLRVFLAVAFLGAFVGLFLVFLRLGVHLE